MRREDSDRAFWAVQYGPLAGWALALTSDRELSHELACAAFVDVLSRHRRPVRWRLYAGVLRLAEVVAADRRGPEGWLWQQAAAYPADLRRCALLEAAGLSPAELARTLRLHPRWRIRAVLRRCAELPPAARTVTLLPRQASLSSRSSWVRDDTPSFR